MFASTNKFIAILDVLLPIPPPISAVISFQSNDCLPVPNPISELCAATSPNPSPIGSIIKRSATLPACFLTKDVPILPVGASILPAKPAVK